MSDSTQSKKNDDVIVALKKAEKMRIEFVANVSHELRTPLTSIKGYTETLLQDLEEGRALDADFLKIILKNSDRLLALINDLLDLSAIESGADELHTAPLDTDEISQHVVKHLERFAQAKQTEVIIQAEAQQVYADPKRIEQVLTNLVDNAIKYCPVKSRILIQWANEFAEGQRWVVLRVMDNGPGIPPKNMDRLFERFYRLDKGRSREMGGTGLGLSIVKHVMQRHDGTVSVESTVGAGTTFICKFPLK
jgi:two-component system phosphate regulon sensor histidine kinase PhoR